MRHKTKGMEIKCRGIQDTKPKSEHNTKTLWYYGIILEGGFYFEIVGE